MGNDPPPFPPPLPPEQLHYARRMDGGGQWLAPILSPRIAIHVWAMAAAAYMVLLFGIPKMEQVFKDFKMDLPLITKITLTLDRWFANDYGWIMALPVAIALPFGMSALLGVGNPTREQVRTREIWMARGVRALMLLLLLWLGLSLFMPYAALIQSISGPSPKK